MAAAIQTGKFLKAKEFANLAGITVRTLHHYDAIGLLKPGRRSAAGYRLYRESDVARLEQITVLKFLGLPLKQIKELLDGQPHDLGRNLRIQRQALEEKRRGLNVAIEAIRQAEQLMQPGMQPDWDVFKKILKVISMQNDNDWMMKYYQGETRDKVEERKSLWSPELQERVSKQWADLIHDVEESLGEDPGSPKAQELADRWNRLVNEFTGGDPGIAAGLHALYADKANWPNGQQQPFSNSAAGFIARASAVRTTKAT